MKGISIAAVEVRTLRTANKSNEMPTVKSWIFILRSTEFSYNWKLDAREKTIAKINRIGIWLLLDFLHTIPMYIVMIQLYLRRQRRNISVIDIK